MALGLLERSITADTAPRLAHLFGTTAQLWMHLPEDWDLRRAIRRCAPEFARPTLERPPAWHRRGCASLYWLAMDGRAIERNDIEREVRRLTDEYRVRCLWFLRPDFYPSDDVEILRVMRQIELHADRAGFVRAAKVRRWLSPSSSATSADC